jgi:hypothetical protein
MRGLVLLCSAAVIAGCAKSNDRAATDTAMAATASPAPATISFADVKGKWTMRAMPETGDSTLIQYELNATGDSTGWTTVFPNRAPVPSRVVLVAGDSIVTEMGPYASVLRKGVNVTTHTVYRLLDGKLVGTTVAHYSTSGPDSVRRLRQEGTRAP